MKKRGFGRGKWNGVGGKVEPGETLVQAAIRELDEEIGVKALPKNLEKVGSIKFHFPTNSGWNQHMHIFFIKKWSGKPIETDEMSPKWYEKENLPYESMWVDDPYWLPNVLAGKKVEGEVHFNNDGTEIKNHSIKEIYK